MAAKQEYIKRLVENACRSGEEFINLYYETFDKRRHVLSKLYTDTSEIVWNGHHVKGFDGLNEYFASLPASAHHVHAVDCQPVSEKVSPGSTTIAVFVDGTVSYDDGKPKIFSQNFVLNAEGDVWKVVSDCFRITP
ncbi:NTF2-related export protein 2-like [Xenia sp. Carnegie-2017]|uniref:NTF2-related export protein 2-like n=1 Tax=Xenia sp. Carnegie-2017 TaxID=2897299 RepID=UPI001F037188|nr:NTF2-related export protein 2-like [Xenia sp. Carnegie-2017]